MKTCGVAVLVLAIALFGLGWWTVFTPAGRGHFGDAIIATKISLDERTAPIVSVIAMIAAILLAILGLALLFAGPGNTARDRSA